MLKGMLRQGLGGLEDHTGGGWGGGRQGGAHEDVQKMQMNCSGCLGVAEGMLRSCSEDAQGIPG